MTLKRNEIVLAFVRVRSDNEVDAKALWPRMFKKPSSTPLDTVVG